MLECRSRRGLKRFDEGKVLWERKRREKMGPRERETKEKESQRSEEESASCGISVSAVSDRAVERETYW